MKKPKNNKYIYLPMDNYEKELGKFLDKGDYKRQNHLAETKKMFEKAAKVYKEMQTTKRITIRVNIEDLIKVKAKAERSGIPYQTLLNTLIRQYSEGRMRVEI